MINIFSNKLFKINKQLIVSRLKHKKDMTIKTQNPNKGTAKPKKQVSLWERAMGLPKTIHLPEEVFLEPHERLSAAQRRKNIEAARKKGLIKANVSY